MKYKGGCITSKVYRASIVHPAVARDMPTEYHKNRQHTKQNFMVLPSKGNG